MLLVFFNVKYIDITMSTYDKINIVMCGLMRYISEAAIVVLLLNT